jgi:hypothetical protein
VAAAPEIQNDYRNLLPLPGWVHNSLFTFRLLEFGILIFGIRRKAFGI